jgi:catalase
MNVIERPGTVLEVDTGSKSVYWESTIDEDIDYEQPRLFYESFSQTDKDHLYANIAGTLVNVDNTEVFDALMAQFGKVSGDLEAGVRAAYASEQESS